MRFVSYRTQDRQSFGVLDASGVHDLGSVMPEAVSLRDAIVQYGGELVSVAGQRLDGGVAFPPEDLQLLPPITNAGKILCAGLNYKAHRDEAGLADAPSFPTLFTRFNDTHVGGGQPVIRPSVTQQLDWEGEIAVIIGRPSSDVTSDEQATAAIAGFSLYNDLSVRDWQMRASQWTPGKNFAGVGAFGPWLVTPDEIADLASVRLTTTVNGEVMQDALVADLIFDIPALIRYITAFTPLAPGDVIVTGTPGGVGLAMDPPRFLQPGDLVVVAASGLGELRTPIA